MINTIPIWIDWIFLSSVLIATIVFHFGNGKPKLLTGIIIVWSLLHSFLAYIGFYQNTDAFPPRVLILFIPTIAFLAFGLQKRQLQWLRRNRNTEITTFIHIVRFPVEIVLYNLFLKELIPEIMTFSAWNMDILAGITAPILGFLWLKQMIKSKTLILWNFIALILVLFIFVIAILSSELPFQTLSFDHPNRAMILFPYILLPATIVPIIIYTHLSDIILLWPKKQ